MKSKGNFQFTNADVAFGDILEMVNNRPALKEAEKEKQAVYKQKYRQRNARSDFHRKHG